MARARCSCVARRERNRIIATHQVTKGAFWDSGSLENEIIAAYFPTARTVIEDTLRKAGVTLDDIDWVIPHNVSLRSWEILLGLIGCPREKLFSAEHWAGGPHDRRRQLHQPPRCHRRRAASQRRSAAPVHVRVRAELELHGAGALSDRAWRLAAPARRTILVTGGTGTLGRELVTRFATRGTTRRSSC